MRATPNEAVSIFVRAASRLSYDSETIRLYLLDQLYWAVSGERATDANTGSAELYSLYGLLDRKARKTGKVYYFVVDGLGELPQYTTNVIPSVFELLPFGYDYFKFLLTGDLRSYIAHFPKTIRAKSFPLVGFSFDETVRLLGTSISDRETTAEIHRRCHGIPGQISDVKRLLDSGLSPSDCIAKLGERSSSLFAYEWERVDPNDDRLNRALAILAHDDKSHTVQTLGELISVSDADLRRMLDHLPFLSIDPEIIFRSEAFRRFAADKLLRYKTWVHKENIKHLKKSADIGDALIELPVHLAEISDFQHFLQYLTPQYIRQLLGKNQTLARVQEAVQTGILFAKRLKRDGDMLRFGIQQSLLATFINSGSGLAEAEALASLGRFDAAATLANSALLREDRLHILAIIANGKLKKGRIVEPELLNQIRVLTLQIDLKGLGERTIDIATQLVCVDPQLALTLIDQAEPTDLDRDRAFARLSIFALETLGQEGSAETIATLRSKATNGPADLLMQSISFLSRKWSVPELLAQVEKIGKPKDKLYLVQAWLRTSHGSSEISEVVKYALDLAIQSDVPMDATILRTLAQRLNSLPEIASLASLVGTFDAHKGLAQKVGPTIDYIRLQIDLARCEAKYDGRLAKIA